MKTLTYEQNIENIPFVNFDATKGYLIDTEYGDFDNHILGIITKVKIQDIKTINPNNLYHKKYRGWMATTWKTIAFRHSKTAPWIQSTSTREEEGYRPVYFDTIEDIIVTIDGYYNTVRRYDDEEIHKS